jgi:hypothetical protein
VRDGGTALHCAIDRRNLEGPVTNCRCEHPGPARSGSAGTLVGWEVATLAITAARGSYCRTKLGKYDFPCGYCTGSVHGFKTGEMVRAEKGARKGVQAGRVAVRESGSSARLTRSTGSIGDCFNVPAGTAWGTSFGRTGFNCRLAPTVAIGRV